MYQYLSRKLTDYAFLNKNLDEKYRKVYEYGFEGVVSISLNILLILMTGFVLNINIELLVYSLYYVILRRKAGGAHAKSHVKCILTYLALAVGSIQLSTWFTNNTFELTELNCFWLLSLVISVIVVCIFAPVDSENKRLELTQKEMLKRDSKRIVLLEVISIIGFMVIKIDRTLINSAISGVLIESIMLLPFFNESRKV